MRPQRDDRMATRDPRATGEVIGGDAQPDQPAGGGGESDHDQPDPIDETVLSVDPAWLEAVDDDAFDPDGSRSGSAGPVDAAVCRTRPRTRPFRADLHMTEVDDRGRPGPTWQARASELSGSSVVIDSRRMCYIGRRVLIAVHMIDDAPAPLAGRVFSCEYLGAGLYRLDLDLERFPDDTLARLWLGEQGR